MNNAATARGGDNVVNLQERRLDRTVLRTYRTRADIDEIVPNDKQPRRGPKESTGPGAGMTRLFVGAGRERGIRPQDLVGAIANEAGLNGRQIGAIEIADRFSLVEVPEASADAVVSALRGRMIKGKKTTVRRERFGAKPRHRAS